jgi:hypothetical protein
MDNNAQQHALQHTVWSKVTYILRQNAEVKLLLDLAITL